MAAGGVAVGSGRLPWPSTSGQRSEKPHPHHGVARPSRRGVVLPITSPTTRADSDMLAAGGRGASRSSRKDGCAAALADAILDSAGRGLDHTSIAWRGRPARAYWSRGRASSPAASCGRRRAARRRRGIRRERPEIRASAVHGVWRRRRRGSKTGRSQTGGAGCRWGGGAGRRCARPRVTCRGSLRLKRAGQSAGEDGVFNRGGG